MIFYVALYLLSIVSANVLVAHFGPSAAPYIAFFLVGFDITCRDRLHELWNYNHLRLKMLLLIVAGSVLSYVLNKDLRQIAVASGTAFFFATLVDTLIYSLLHNTSYTVKVNSSNVGASIVDSLLFILIAFGTPVLWGIVLKQILFKIIGGFLWGILLEYTILLRHKRNQMELPSR